MLHLGYRYCGVHLFFSFSLKRQWCDLQSGGVGVQSCGSVALVILAKNSAKVKLANVIGKEVVPPLNIPCMASRPLFPVFRMEYSSMGIWEKHAPVECKLMVDSSMNEQLFCKIVATADKIIF